MYAGLAKPVLRQNYKITALRRERALQLSPHYVPSVLGVLTLMCLRMQMYVLRAQARLSSNTLAEAFLPSA